MSKTERLNVIARRAQVASTGRLAFDPLNPASVEDLPDPSTVRFTAHEAAWFRHPLGDL